MALMVGQAAAQTPDPQGDWLGTLTVRPGAALHLAIHVKSSQGALTGSIDSLDQGVSDLSLGDVKAAAGHLSFNVPKIAAEFRGDWDASINAYVGQWGQGSQHWPLTLVHGRAAPRPVVAGLDGAWDGALDVGALGKLRLTFSVSTGPDGTVGALRSIDQGSGPAPLTLIRRDGPKVRFEVSAISGVFEGDLSPDGKTLTGHWTQGDQALPLNLVKRAPGSVGPVAYKRTQQPKAPYPYRSLEVGYDNPIGHNHLAGTLTLPDGPGPFPAALLITGSGLQARDETLLGHKPFLVLADYLTRRGLAVLRIDDRTMGGSTGDVIHATSADFATDVEAGVIFLASHKDIDHGKIGLIGHSEGGMIAPMVAVHDPTVAWIVLMAGPGIPGAKLLAEQGRLISLAAGQSPEAAAKASASNARIYAAVASAKDAAEAKKKSRPLLLNAGMSEVDADAALSQLSSDWFRFFLKYDPAPMLSKVRIPILAIDGALDLQVPPREDLDAIRAASAKNPDVTTLELPRLNHLFQTARTGAPSEYQDIEETLSPTALQVIGDWIEAHTR